MHRHPMLPASLFAATLLLPPAAWAAESRAFIRDAIQGNLAEIAVGKLAQEKGTNPAIKAMGRELIADHNKANQAAMDVAKEMKLSMPTAPNEEQLALHTRLAKEPSSKQFDEDFVNNMLQDHQKDIDKYQAASGSSDAAGQYAKATLPVLQKHLADLQKAAKDIGL